jgi:hypothetical protein
MCAGLILSGVITVVAIGFGIYKHVTLAQVQSGIAQLESAAQSPEAKLIYAQVLGIVNGVKK